MKRGACDIRSAAARIAAVCHASNAPRFRRGISTLASAATIRVTSSAALKSRVK